MIEGNIAGSTAVKSSAGIYCANTNGNVELNLSGGCIQNNTGAGGAGGIYMENGKINVSGSICISDNYSNGTVNNVSLNRGCTITVADGLSGNIGVTYAPEYGTAGYPVRVAQGKSQHPISDGDCSHFSSDNENYGVLKKKTSTGNELYLAKPFGISLNGAEFSPAFDSFTAIYTSTVANDVGQVGITATIGDSADITDMSIQINNGEKIPITSGVEKTADLIVGKNQIVIYAPAGAALDKYTFEITREEAEGNNVNITSYKDGTVWTENPPAYKLSSDNGTTFVTDLDVVPDGTYKIYSGDTDTKVTVTVNGAEANARVDYYTVTFYDKDTMLTAPASQTVLKGTAASAPTETLTKTGYTFDKWVKAGGDGTEYTFTEEVTKKTSLFASWKPVSYKIEYHLDGGTSAGNPASYTIESSAITLNNPTKEGYIFTGWSGTDLAENSTSVTIVPGSTGDRTYTTHWKLADYMLVLHTNGGSGGTDLTAYTYGTGAALPIDWKKTGYAFAGWYDNEGLNGDKVTEIFATDTGDREYWAKWKPTDYSVTYVLDGGKVSGNPANYTIESNAIILNNPAKGGYTFAGWSGTGLTDNSTSVTIASGSAGDRIYTAHWKLASYAVALQTNGGSGGTDLTSYTYGTGATLPVNWTKKGYTFAGWYDNENFNGTAVTNISDTDTGNKEYWAKWTDNIAPVIGSLSYNYQPKNFWHWLIGKDSLIITVPVTEEGSGADELTYTVTWDGGTSSAETAAIQNGEAKITVSADFKGTISIVCTDKANNTSAGVTVGAGLSAAGIIIEDNAPQIDFKTENAELVQPGEYRTAPDIAVSVTDDKDNAVSGGIDSVSYKIGNGSEKTVSHDYTVIMVVNDSFTIPASEIPAGETVITVTATDNAGNSITEEYTVKVHTHSGTLVPAKPATCMEDGHEAYYTCSCGKWFADSTCTNEITDHESVIVGKLGHDFSGKYLFDANGHWKVCRHCNIPQTSENHVFDDDNDTGCNKCGYEREIGVHTHSVERTVAATEPTCTAVGNREYYI